MQALDRARGALYGLAIGDALGMPAEMLSRAEVVARWGPLLSGFEAAPPGHPIADGMPAGSALAVAAAVSWGIEGLDARNAIDQAINLTLVQNGRPPSSANHDVPACIHRAAMRVRGRTLEGIADYLVTLDRILARVDWLSGNAREARQLTSRDDLVQAARQLRGRTARASILVRDGANGCLLATRVVTRIPAPRVTPVDTTGAGDTHSGVFLAALADGLEPARAAGRANAAAALSVTKPGPATSPARAQLDAWMPGA